MIVVSAESVLVVSFGSRFHLIVHSKERQLELLFSIRTLLKIVELPAIRLSFGAESDPPDLGTYPQKGFRTERTNAPLFPTLAHARNEIGTCVSIQNGAFLVNRKRSSMHVSNSPCFREPNCMRNHLTDCIATTNGKTWHSHLTPPLQMWSLIRTPEPLIKDSG